MGQHNGDHCQSKSQLAARSWIPRAVGTRCKPCICLPRSWMRKASRWRRALEQANWAPGEALSMGKPFLYPLPALSGSPSSTPPHLYPFSLPPPQVPPPSLQAWPSSSPHAVQEAPVPHVAPPTRLHLQFPRDTGLILMCARKIGIPGTNGQKATCHHGGNRTLR